ncbi:Replicase polyprotein 1a [Trachymyrmex septentrionalis]|uniref:Replicase polyprotein 1a n=1 Tax=Trachymyrmex septentrionalis TaxID=34720 RepID=A0A195FUA6_9HYME|nr:Replicase polyprotein 1a [Trachymyrmex septentrionalis]
MHETARETSYCKSTEILEVVTRNSHERRMLTTDGGGIVGIDASGNEAAVLRSYGVACVFLRHDDASRMQMQQTLEDEDDNDEDDEDDGDDDDDDEAVDNDDDDDDNDGAVDNDDDDDGAVDNDDDDDEAVDDDEDHVDASSAATAPDVEYARSRRTLSCSVM